MSDTNNPGDKTQTRAPSKPMSLKRPVEQGTVRQSFSHGRSKSVVVETVKRRTIGAAPGTVPTREPAAAPPPRPASVAPAPSAATRPAGRSASGVVLRTLSEQERDARAAALADAQRREAEARARAEAEVQARRDREEAERREREAAEARRREEEERRRQEDELRRKAAEDSRRRAEEEAARAAPPAPVAEAGEAPAAPAATPAAAPQAPRPAAAAPAARPTPPRPAAAGAPQRPAVAPARPGSPAAARPGAARPVAPRPAAPQAPAEPRRTITADVRKPRDLNFMARPAPAPEPEKAPSPTTAARPAGAATAARPAGRTAGAAMEDESDTKRVIRRPGMPLKIITPPKTPKSPGGDRNRGRLTIANATAGEEERTRSVASFRRRQQRMSGHRHEEAKEKIAREVTIPETITIQELANRMSERAVDVIRMLMKQGQIHKITDVIDSDTAQLIAEDMGHTVRRVAESDVEEGLTSDEPDLEEDLEPRPPVVTIMGHVDHGKTSLLDAIRRANVVEGEAGGITQHIGAYHVETERGMVTFLDTPGHAAFTSMRARGAMCTDIAILVVAADDGIMPQTIEAINHAKAAKIPIIVAINKMDKPEANPDRIKQQLTEYDLIPEEWGGDTIICPISAKKGTGLEELLEMVLVTAEVAELKANPNRRAKGTVIEARLDKSRGPIATLLVQNGTLNQGDIIIAGTAVGRVRVMTNDKGRTVKTAGPSTPVEITGLGDVPAPGDDFNAVTDERMARELVEQRRQAEKDAAANAMTKVTLDNLFAKMQEGEMKELPLIVKADVQGSAEAVKASLEKISNDEVRVKVIHTGVGAINESDILLASTAGAIIVGFNVRADAAAQASGQRAKVDIRYYRVIYDAIDEIESAMKGMLAPKFQEVVIGHAEVRMTYKVSAVGTIAGCMVKDGKVTRDAKVRVLRDNIVIHEGEVGSLQRFKDAAKEVTAGYECGMSILKFNDIKEGDIFECFAMEQIKL